MRLATVNKDGTEMAAIVVPEGIVSITDINGRWGTAWPVSLFEIIAQGHLESLKEWYGGNRDQVGECITPFAEVSYAPLYRHPRKIWGIGLNYADHATDLNERAPDTEPASFMKPDTTIIGPHDTIRIPLQSERTTAEAELGVIIGRKCQNVSEEEAPHVIAGFTTVIDMAAEDILQINPRYLTRSKSFDTFFSFGPHLVTADEVADVRELQVSTVHNGIIHRQNKVANMMFDPWFLVSFHSKVMTLLPGDILSTGTPGAVVIRDGDRVECRIGGFQRLVNQVEDLKLKTAGKEGKAWS